MSQQINLYSPIFRRTRKLFTAAAMLQAMGLLLAGLLAFYGYARVQVVALERQSAEFERQLRADLARLKTLSASPGADAGEKALDVRIAELEARLRANEQLASGIASGGRDTGFAGHLRALSRQRVEGVWLTSINVAGESGELSLTGRALRADLVPQYIERLRQDPAMRGQRFATLNIQGAPEPAAGAPQSDAIQESLEFRLLSSRAGDS